MAFNSLSLKKDYRSPKDDVVEEVFIPALKEAKSYKRAVGFFSSTSLAEITKGISGLLKNKGKIQIVASPILSESDEEAIKLGYEKRKEVIEKKLLGELDKPIDNDYFKNERLNLLANLIANNILDLKIAFTDTGKESGMYHEKLGIFEDFEGNKIAFDGSMNESLTAMRYNYESVNVYCSWTSDDKDRIQSKINAFDNIWNNTDNNLSVVEFPSVTQKILDKFKRKDYSIQDLITNSVKIDSQELKNNNISYNEIDTINVMVESPEIEFLPKGPIKPENLTYHDYQLKAIDTWKTNNFSGIFDMATGTGKTLTALGALTCLSNEINGNFCAIILCPYVHLVTQWVEDIKRFNIKPIIAFGNSPQKNWKEKLSQAISRRNSRSGEKGFFCLISTIRTFSGSYVQEKIERIKKPILVICDEAHNAGAQGIKKHLIKEKFQYRLGLSATLDRHFDSEGTNFLYDFFGKKCIEYGLKQAIEEKHLCKYKYFPVLVYLDLEERDEYKKLSLSIAREIVSDSKTGNKKLSEKGKRLCILRSRIIAGCKNKIDKLVHEIEPYKNDNKILIYCGTAKYDNDLYEIESDESEIKQIDTILRELYATYKLKISKFVAEKNNEERTVLITKFTEGTELQALAAIKCLDEGVNIPSIKTAFILASSTNPKEYIQRRGRVLRKFEGKEYAEIYDFITMPYDFYTAKNTIVEENNFYNGLIKNELKRIMEFNELADNEKENLELIHEIKDIYNIDFKKKNPEEELYE